MAWALHTDDLIAAIISTVGTPTGGLGTAVCEAYPTIWMPTAPRLPALFIEADEVVNTPTEGRSMQEYRFSLYYCLDRKKDSNPVRTARSRAEGIAASLAATPRLGITDPSIEHSYVTRLATHNDASMAMADAGQDVTAVLIEFYVRVAETQ